MHAAVPPELLDAVVSRLDPVAVYLFGSQARGDAGPDSDVDLFVVLDDDAPTDAVRDLRRDAYDLRRGPVDIVVRRRSRFSRAHRHPGTLDEAVVGEGVPLYCREQPVVLDGEVGGLEEALEDWLEVARKDLRAASLMLDDDDLVSITATHLQQALEKVLKAELIAKAVRTWKTHNLVELAAAAGPDVRHRLAGIDLALVADWAVEPRYPEREGAPPPPQEADVRRLFPLIQAYYDEARARLLPGG